MDNIFMHIDDKLTWKPKLCLMCNTKIKYGFGGADDDWGECMKCNSEYIRSGNIYHLELVHSVANLSCHCAATAYNMFRKGKIEYYDTKTLCISCYD
jgi:hypothetical protein